MHIIQCGCDPEVAITKDGLVKSAIGLFAGTKDKPHPVKGSKVGLHIQEDNVSLEFNIAPTSLENFSQAVHTALCELDTVVSSTCGKGYSYALGDSFSYTDTELLHPNAAQFGCDPDFLAHRRGEQRTPPRVESVGRHRFFAGHIHVGYDVNSCPIPRYAIVQGMELGAYMPMVVDGRDNQNIRRKFYGLSGLFRPKPYGLEYRTPSNAWLTDREMAENILDAASHIINKPRAYRALYDAVRWDVVEQVVNSSGVVIRNSTYQPLRDIWRAFYSLPFEETK